MDNVSGELLEQFSDWLSVYARTDTVRNRIHYAARLIRWSECEDPWSLDSSQLSHFLLTTGVSPSTRKNAADGLRALYRWGILTGRTTTNPSLDLQKIRVPRGVPHPTPDPILTQALSECTRLIDVLMILLATAAGIRRGEIAQLHTNDIRTDSILILGKGGHERLVPIHSELSDFLDLVPKGWVFPSNKNPTGHMLAASVGQRLGDLLGPGWSGHSLRHRFATEAFRASGDILAVQRLLGHKNLNTTMIYTEPPSPHLSQAVQGVRIPLQADQLRKLKMVDSPRHARSVDRAD